ncbi:hypothetical protein KR026_012379 [Drosophila bipectinata]|nr:hypothetical protein KR026_012379 [Drosophila bipectinata]
MFNILRRQNVPKLSARLLRKIVSSSRFLGFLFFRYGNNKDGLIILEDNKKWWRCFMFLHRIVCVCVVGYVYSDWFIGPNCILQQALKCTRTVLVLIWIIRQQFFMNTEVISLANKSLKLFRRVRSLGNHKRVGFGGKREFVLIMLILFCRIYDFTSILAYYIQKEEFYYVLKNIFEWWSVYYAILSLEIILNFTVLWYLSLGELYSEFNEIMQNDVNKSRRPKFDIYLDVYRKIHELSTSFNKIYYSHLIFHILSTILYIGDTSYQMVQSLSLEHCWVWTGILKIMFEYKMLCSVVERIFKELGKTRLLLFELSMNTDTKESDQAVEMFITFLNMHPFRVQLFGLFAISNGWFLLMVSNTVNYLIIVIQFVLQHKQI